MKFDIDYWQAMATCYRKKQEVAAAEVERLRASELTSFENNGYLANEFGNARAEIERLRAALHDIAIGGNGERNWTLDEVHAVAWDALEPKP